MVQFGLETIQPVVSLIHDSAYDLNSPELLLLDRVKLQYNVQSVLSSDHFVHFGGYMTE